MMGGLDITRGGRYMTTGGPMYMGPPISWGAIFGCCIL
jgi:hypothetical protein